MIFCVVLYGCNIVFSHLSSIFQMLRNCKVARVLPRIVDCAKSDRSAILRARYELPNLGDINVNVLVLNKTIFIVGAVIMLF